MKKNYLERGGSHLEHDLGKLLIVVLAELPQHDAAELGEVDVPVLGHLVGHVDALLLHDVHPQDHHCCVQVLEKGESVRLF